MADMAEGRRTMIDDRADALESLHASFLAAPGPGGLSPTRPLRPTRFTLPDDQRQNYVTLGYGWNRLSYGATGIMAVQDLDTMIYGEVAPGTIFLFPGTSAENPPPYLDFGQLSINAVRGLAPLRLVPGGGSLHGQLCDLLHALPTSFIGFSIDSYPYQPQRVGYNSDTCNAYWFNGNRTLDATWQGIVRQALAETVGRP